MNKTEKEITNKDDFTEILKQGKFTTIALCRNNEPYIVTMNYGFDESKNALYFHCSQKGLKIDFINENSIVCATVIDDKGYKMGECDHGFQSIVFWGKLEIVENLDEKKHALNVLLNHLEDNPEPIKERNLKQDKIYEKLCILRLKIIEITGKKG